MAYSAMSYALAGPNGLMSEQIPDQWFHVECGQSSMGEGGDQLALVVTQHLVDIRHRLQKLMARQEQLLRQRTHGCVDATFTQLDREPLESFDSGKSWESLPSRDVQAAEVLQTNGHGTEPSNAHQTAGNGMISPSSKSKNIQLAEDLQVDAYPSDRSETRSDCDESDLSNLSEENALGRGRSAISTASSRLPRTSTRIDAELRDVASRASNLQLSTKNWSSSSDASLHRIQSLARRILQRSEFVLFMTLAITAYVAIVGVEVELVATRPLDQVPKIFEPLSLGFAVLFFLELMLRVIGLGCKAFFLGPDRYWNCFDLVIVLSAASEIVLHQLLTVNSESASHVEHVRVFRGLRIARMFRGVRAIRILRFVGSIRSLLQSVLNTASSLYGIVVMLLTIFYVFGVVLTQATVDYCREQQIRLTGNSDVLPVCSNADLDVYWSTIPKSMFTLFKSVAGGISWHEVVDPLGDVSWVAVSFFVLFIAFTLFAVLNIVTGVFCQSAIESAAADKETAVLQQLQNKKKHTEAMMRVFTEIDEDKSRKITIEEFEKKMDDENMAAYFQSIDIDTADAWTLFKLIDNDGSGCLDLEEFVSGCLQLRGTAKAIHVAKMSYENKLMRNMLRDMDGSLLDLQASVNDLHSKIWPVVRKSTRESRSTSPGSPSPRSKHG